MTLTNFESAQLQGLLEWIDAHRPFSQKEWNRSSGTAKLLEEGSGHMAAFLATWTACSEEDRAKFWNETVIPEYPDENISRYPSPRDLLPGLALLCAIHAYGGSRHNSSSERYLPAADDACRTQAASTGLLSKAGQSEATDSLPLIAKMHRNRADPDDADPGCALPQ